MLLNAGRGAGVLQGFIVNDQHATAERLQCNNEGNRSALTFQWFHILTYWLWHLLISLSAVFCCNCEHQRWDQWWRLAPWWDGRGWMDSYHQDHLSLLQPSSTTSSELSIYTTGGQAMVIINQLKGYGHGQKGNRRWQVSQQMVKASVTITSEYNFAIISIQHLDSAGWLYNIDHVKEWRHFCYTINPSEKQWRVVQFCWAYLNSKISASGYWSQCAHIRCSTSKRWRTISSQQQNVYSPKQSVRRWKSTTHAAPLCDLGQNNKQICPVNLDCVLLFHQKIRFNYFKNTQKKASITSLDVYLKWEDFYLCSDWIKLFNSIQFSLFV